MNDTVNSIYVEILQQTFIKPTVEVFCRTFYGVDEILKYSAVGCT